MRELRGGCGSVSSWDGVWPKLRIWLSTAYTNTHKWTMTLVITLKSAILAILYILLTAPCAVSNMHDHVATEQYVNVSHTTFQLCIKMRKCSSPTDTETLQTVFISSIFLDQSHKLMSLFIEAYTPGTPKIKTKF